MEFAVTNWAGELIMRKKQDVWQVKLEAFKRQEQPETLLMLAGSVELTRIALAWTGMHVVRKTTLKSCSTNDEESVWRWLWDNIEYSQDELLSRIPGYTVRTARNFKALVANRVLYPDGTVNSFVSKYMKEKVLSLFGIRRRISTRPTG